MAAAAIPSAPARTALLNAYRLGFANTFDHLMIIGVVVAAIGSVCAYALVRQRDFVPSYSPSARLPSSNPRRWDCDCRRGGPGPRASPAGQTPATNGPPGPSPTPPYDSWPSSATPACPWRASPVKPAWPGPPYTGASRTKPIWSPPAIADNPGGTSPRAVGPTPGRPDRLLGSVRPTIRRELRGGGRHHAGRHAKSATPWSFIASGWWHRRMAYAVPCSSGPRSSARSRRTSMPTSQCRCSPARSWPVVSAAARARRTGPDGLST